MITRAAVQSTVIGTMRLERGNRITDSTLGQGVSKRTLVGKQHAIGFDMPIRFLSRNVRIPVVPDIRLSLQPTFVTVAGRGSFLNNLVPPRLLLHNGELGRPRKACTFVRESPTRIRPTVPQKLHGSADCLPLTDVLRFVVWAGILNTSNPARNTATVLPARLVAEGELLEAIGRSTEKAGLTIPVNPNFRRRGSFCDWRRPSPLIVSAGCFSRVPTQQNGGRRKLKKNRVKGQNV